VGKGDPIPGERAEVEEKERVEEEREEQIEEEEEYHSAILLGGQW